MAPDLVTIPEPPDGAWIVVGDDPHVLLVRDDYSAREAGYDPGVHWFLAHDGMEPALSWGQVTGPESDQGQLVADRSVIQRVFTQAELDQAVREAQVIPLGTHLKEPGGWCRTCSVQHSEVEWARIHDQLTEEADRC